MRLDQYKLNIVCKPGAKQENTGDLGKKTNHYVGQAKKAHTTIKQIRFCSFRQKQSGSKNRRPEIDQ